MGSAQEIYGQFDRQFSEGMMDSWATPHSSHYNSMTIDISNCYLMPAKEATGMENIPFHKGVNPWGILHEMTKGDRICTYLHTEDNYVCYFTTYKDGTGNKKSVALKFKELGHLSHLLNNGQIPSKRTTNLPDR
jgi:hypothetical protein